VSPHHCFDHTPLSGPEPTPRRQPGRRPGRRSRGGPRRPWSWADEVRPYQPCPLPNLTVLALPGEHTGQDDHTERDERGEQAEQGGRGGPGRAGRRGLLLTPFDDPRRAREWIVLGRAATGRPGRLALVPADVRFHVHVMGRIGAGKSTWLANWVLQQAEAGRGVVLIDCQGDLARHVLARLPRSCADRLVILDPDEQQAPPAYNPLAPDDPGEQAAEWAAEQVAGTLKALYSASWGPRMQDLLRGACLTLARRPGSTIPDLVRLLTEDDFRAQVLAEYDTPPGLGTMWDDYEDMTPNQRANLRAPLVTRLRDVLGRRFARDLLTPATSTFSLGEVLDGGVLIARLPKGEIGTETSRLVSGLLVSCLWGATTRRARRDPDQRPDASIVLDEAQNVLALPIEVDFALSESRGYRVGWVLAHQHGDQLPARVGAAVAANARNKIFFTIEPDDARTQARHFRPGITEHDLSNQPAYHICARTVADGHDQDPYTLSALPLPEPVPGRADWLRARARARTGLSHADRATTPDTEHGTEHGNERETERDTAVPGTRSEANTGVTANVTAHTEHRTAARRHGRQANGRSTDRIRGRSEGQGAARGAAEPEFRSPLHDISPATPATETAPPHEPPAHPQEGTASS
jgi:type IV secretion system coupling TraD/TrwB family protein